ncbi:ribonuclease HII [soil metagenome]
MPPKKRLTEKYRPSLQHERAWQQRGFARIAGVDEAGRGPLAGPVSVAAVILPEGFEHGDLNDSKQLTEAKRERIYEELIQCPGLIWHAVLIDAEEIDRINILEATREGMRRSVNGLAGKPDAVLIDGLPVPKFPLPQEALVKGDSRSFSIAAASVIAKVTRDRLMLDAAKKYPQYGFERHKGYGTKQHLEALRKHGPCPLHRCSFAPVAQLTLAIDAA